MRRSLSAALLCASLTPMTALAADPVLTTLQVSATAEIRATPDTAMLSAGVMTQAVTARTAMQENASRMTSVIAAIKAAGIDARDIQTSGISLQPQYRYANNQPPVVTGYQASNMVNVRVRKIDQVGPVMDALVSKGANQINGPTFIISDEDTALDQARRDAVARARKRAELYADAAGLKVRRILAITEGGGMPQPMPEMRGMAVQMAADAAQTPVAAGDSTLSVTVNISFELAETAR